MTPTTIIQGNPVTNPKLSSGGFGPWPSQIRRCARIAPCPVVLRHVPTCTLARYPPSLPPCAAAFNKGFQSTPVLFSMASAVRFPRVVRSEQPSASFPRSSPPTRSPRHVRPKMACALPCCASSSAYTRAGERAMRITEMGRALRAAHSQRDAGHTPHWRSRPAPTHLGTPPLDQAVALERADAVRDAADGRHPRHVRWARVHGG